MSRRSSRSRGREASGAAFLLVGLALGLAVAAGVYFSDLRSGGGIAPAPASASTPARTSPSSSSTTPERSAASPARSAPATTAQPRAARTDPSEESGEPRFDFYEILPQYEVVVPGADTSSGRSASRTTPAPATSGSATSASAAPAARTTAPGSYVLQAGSFRSHVDADRRQASLALLGIESRIQKVTIDDGEFHRVRVGPIDDPAEVDRIRSALRAAGVESIVMKVDER